MARFGSLRHARQRLLYPYRTHDLCPIDLCPPSLRLHLRLPDLIDSALHHIRILRFRLEALVDMAGQAAQLLHFRCTSVLDATEGLNCIGYG
jgi:hypothetical protein